MIIIVIAYILFTIKVNMKEIDRENENKDEFLNLYLRIMTDYFQMISTIGKIKVNFIYGIGEFFENFYFISDFLGNFFLFFYPLDCFYSILAKSSSDTNVFYLNLYFLMSLYPLILLINISFWVIKGYLSKRTIHWIFRRFFLSIFLISYMVQQSFINAYFKYINCVSIEEKLYLKSFLLERCWIGNHLFHFSIFILPSLLFWMVVYPSIILFSIRAKRKEAKLRRLSITKQITNYKMFSFFTDGLKENFNYWEILLMFRKYIFIILSIFPIANSLIINLWILCIFSFVFLFFYIEKKPYRFEHAINLSLFSNIIILIAVLGLTVLYVENNSFNQMMFISIFLILNIILFWKWGYDIYKIKKNDFWKKIQSLKKFLGQAFSKNQSKSKDSEKCSQNQKTKVFKKVTFSPTPVNRNEFI